MVALNNIDIVYIGGDKKQQIISIFNEEIIINNRFLHLINNDDQQIVLSLSSGIEGAMKERKYILSDYYIPYRGESVPITQTPFILPLLKHLNMLVDTFPPTSNQSHKSFQDNVRISLLCIEYFSINGCTSIESVGERLVKTFKEEIINGWYSALKIKQRWDALTNEIRSRNWFIKRSEISKKSGSDYAFNLMEFRQCLGSAIFGRGLNDIPDEIVEEMVLPEKLRTPYKYNGNITSEHGFSSRYFLDSFVTINSLFFCSGLDKPISNPEVLSNEMATKEPSRTKMPSIFEVTSTIRFLYQVVAQHQTIAKSLVDVKNM